MSVEYKLVSLLAQSSVWSKSRYERLLRYSIHREVALRHLSLLFVVAPGGSPSIPVAVQTVSRPPPTTALGTLRAGLPQQHTFSFFFFSPFPFGGSGFSRWWCSSFRDCCFVALRSTRCSLIRLKSKFNKKKIHSALSTKQHVSTTHTLLLSSAFFAATATCSVFYWQVRGDGVVLRPRGWGYCTQRNTPPLRASRQPTCP